MRKLIEIRPCSVKNTTDLTDSVEQLEDVALQRARNIKFKSLLKENYQKFWNIIHPSWTRDI